MRVDIKTILRDSKLCRELLLTTLIAIQAREDITTTEAQAATAWENAHRGESKQ